VQQHELRAPRGAKKNRKRVARGNAAGQGTYAGRGLKGQQSRSGSGPHIGFEGGQTPLIRRLPRRRGFRNPFRVEYTPVNIRDLARLPEGIEVTPESMHEHGLVRSLRRPVKLLGDGEISTAITVRAHRVSPAARAKIEAAGGTVEELSPRPVVEEPKVEEPKKEKAKPAKAKKKQDQPEEQPAEEPKKEKAKPAKARKKKDQPEEQPAEEPKAEQQDSEE